MRPVLPGLGASVAALNAGSRQHDLVLCLAGQRLLARGQLRVFGDLGTVCGFFGQKLGFLAFSAELR